MTKFFSYIAYAFLKLISYLPLGVLYIFSDLIFFMVYHLVGYRKQVVTTNLKNSFPHKSDAEIIQIRKEFFSHFCDSFIETIKLWTISEKEIKKRCKFLQADFFEQYKQDGKSVIAILGHYGNWEWMTSYPAWADVNLLPIYKPLHNKVFDKLYIQLRERFGAKTLPKDDTLRTMLGYRNRKEFTVTVFLGDQTPNKRNIHYWTSFLNQDTPILQGTERIAKKLDQAVVFINMQKVKRGYYEVEFIPLFDNPKETEEFEITEKHTRILEEYISKNPAYWLWSHKRWKHKKQ
ncbi:lysophospholipid acyltransferase family protein [Marinifilum caeruleilacunae]|uniref:Lipid A biosynthesis acyltransferase n=1 Tax=Marinifilum caeruleilacunae TaxID=2499076 RepID=A0ABX1WW10_9BACT|nr:lysophospholipid acyltransferase family protein [Marinifilum caeruleilacunae]NOU60282.1 lipid A biosynthesis acyltransferase [Marinifilum caeruleilacunae]